MMIDGSRVILDNIHVHNLPTSWKCSGEATGILDLKTDLMLQNLERSIYGQKIAKSIMFDHK